MDLSVEAKDQCHISFPDHSLPLFVEAGSLNLELTEAASLAVSTFLALGLQATVAYQAF